MRTKGFDMGDFGVKPVKQVKGLMPAKWLKRIKGDLGVKVS